MSYRQCTRYVEQVRPQRGFSGRTCTTPTYRKGTLMVPPNGRDAGASVPAADVMTPLPQYSTEQYREVTTFEQALEMAQASFGMLVTAEDLGDGFVLVKDEDKRSLVGVPMVCLYAQLRTGDLGGYVVTRCVAKGGRKVVIVDGSTGMYDQLKTYMETHGGRWINIWNKGLRASDYKVEVETKEGPALIDATTFYIDTSS